MLLPGADACQLLEGRHQQSQGALPLSAYPRPAPCPVLTYARVAGCSTEVGLWCYKACGTDMFYGATRCTVLTRGMVLQVMNMLESKVNRRLRSPPSLPAYAIGLLYQPALLAYATNLCYRPTRALRDVYC